MTTTSFLNHSVTTSEIYLITEKAINKIPIKQIHVTVLRNLPTYGLKDKNVHVQVDNPYLHKLVGPFTVYSLVDNLKITFPHMVSKIIIKKILFSSHTYECMHQIRHRPMLNVNVISPPSSKWFTLAGFVNQ